jgi:glycosyltransferase involved in cell wall biosynthesis
MSAECGFEHDYIHFVFVDDGSRDGTLDMLQDMQKCYPLQIDVLRLPQNRGKAEAVRHGIRYALSHGAELVGFLGC